MSVLPYLAWGNAQVGSAALNEAALTAAITVKYADGSSASYTADAVLPPLPPPPALPPGVAAHSLSVINVAPGTEWPTLGSALLGIVTDGTGTINMAAGTYYETNHVGFQVLIQGAGRRKTIIKDPQSRWAYGKGLLHCSGMPNMTIKGIGFVAHNKEYNSSDGQTSDGSAGLYFEQISGTATCESCAFDGCPNGIFAQLTCQNFVATDNEYGLITPMGLTDGKSHDQYIHTPFMTETNCRHYAIANGNGTKYRGPDGTMLSNLTTSGNYYAVTGGALNTNGRCVENTLGGAWSSTNDVFVQSNNANITVNYLASGDEPGLNGPSNVTITGATMYIGRFGTIICCDAGGTMKFVNCTVYNTGEIIGVPPSVIFSNDPNGSSTATNITGFPGLPAMQNGSNPTPPAPQP